MTQDDSIQINRRIHLGRRLGKGGMGTVIDGFASDLGQYFAVKILHPDHAGDPELRARFEEEAAIMASIDHPGNLPVYGISHDADDNLCYVMKKVEGRTLGELIDERGKRIANLPARQRLLSILLDVCETVACAHETGVVHRDLKPDNILIDRHDSVFVIDWGLARRGTPGSCESTQTRTLPGVVMGSPGYMSPEQADGKGASAGPGADVFGLGAILYEILTGRRPFESNQIREEMLGAIHKDPEHPRKANVLVPRSISEVCMKALRKDPKQRYKNAGELANDLRAFLEGRPVSAVRANLPEKVYYASRSNPFRASAIGTAILTSIMLLLFVGAQVVIDLRLADKAHDRLEIIDVDLQELVAKSDELRRQLADESLDEAERVGIEAELRRTDSRWALGEIEAMRLLGSVGTLRFIRKDPEINSKARDRLFNMIESSNRRGHAGFADAITSTILERKADGNLQLDLTDAELLRLEQLSAESRRLLLNPDS